MAKKKKEKIKPRPRPTIEQMTSEELAEILDRQYFMLMQTKDNILAIRTEIQKRKQKKEDPDG